MKCQPYPCEWSWLATPVSAITTALLHCRNQRARANTSGRFRSNHSAFAVE
jgi:nitric oxide synthase oxygenase domain/subunit